MANEAQTQAGLEDEPPARPVDELRVLHKTSTTLSAFVVGPQGVQMEVRIEGVTFDTLEGAALRAIAFENALVHKGLSPVPQPEPVVVQAAVGGNAAGGATTGGGPVEIPGEGIAPPRCSIHGPMTWKEGTNDRGKYSFYSCQHKLPDGSWCKPAKGAA